MEGKTVYKNVAVLDASRSKAEMCDVVTEGARIKSVLPAGSVTTGCAYEGRGNTALIPGLVNAHCHAPMTLLRGLGEELPLMDWLKTRIWPIENKMTRDEMTIGARLAMLEMLTCGVTCFAELYFDIEDLPQAVIDCGMRIGLSRGLQKGTDRDRLGENIKLAEKWNGADEHVRIQFGPHAVYTVTRPYIEEIVEAANSFGAGIQMHWLETKGEWSLCDCKDTMSPEEYLEKTGLSSVKHLVLAHGVWIDDKALDFYAKDNITIVHNPSSNMKLGSGTARVPEFLSHGVSVALGTDGAASNNRQDVWDEMRLAALLHKGVTGDPSVVRSSDVLKMATVNGARALGFEKVGLIREGWAADMALIDLDRPQYVGWNCENLGGYLVYAGSSADVKAAVAAGRMLYNNGEFLTLDREKILADAREARKILTK